MTTSKFLLIGIDGLRVNDALDLGLAPSLAALITRGACATMRMEVPTISGPGWSSILTGVPHADHGVFDNTFHGHRLFNNPDLLSLAHYADHRRTTFAAAGWPALVDPLGPAPVIRARTDQQASEHHRVVVRDGELYGYRYADGEIAAWARSAVRDGGPDAGFVYLGEVDEAGHLYGGTSPEYRAAIERVDAHLGTIIDEVQTRVSQQDESWLVAVTTDHGHLDEGGHGGGDDVVTRSFLALELVGPGEPVALPEQIAPHEIPSYLLAHLDR